MLLAVIHAQVVHGPTLTTGQVLILVPAVLGAFSAILAFITGLRNRHRLQEVHVLVNDRLSTAIAQIDDLKTERESTATRSAAALQGSEARGREQSRMAEADKLDAVTRERDRLRRRLKELTPPND
jgi:hypothetical protein